MQHQSDIHTISKTAPPSYAEAMRQSASMKDNPYVPATMPSGQPPTTMYEQGCSQMSGYPSSAPAPYQHPSNFYSNVAVQSPYNPSYVSMEQSQQIHSMGAPCIVHAETLRPREEKTCCERCATCNKKVAVIIIFIILILYLIKVIVSQAM